MDHQFFDSLSVQQAMEFLDRFLQLGRQGVAKLQPSADAERLCLDYSLSSLPKVMKWMMRQVHFQWAPVPEEEPQWIRQVHRDGLVEFDEDSKSTILRAAYYLGECFARLHGMRWATGNPDYMEKNMPVVAGFENEQELSPLQVTENLFRRILARGAPDTHIDTAVQAWMRDCPARQK
jgi:hypothetical protein